MAAVLALTFVRSVLVLVALSFLVGYTFFSIPPALDTFLLSSLPDRHRASTYSFYSSSMMVVQAMGSGTVGLTVARGASYTAVFRSITAVVGVVALGLFLLYRAGRLPSHGAASAETLPGRGSR